MNGHIITAGKQLLKKKAYRKVEELAKDIVTHFINFDPESKISNKDKIHLYATEVLTLGLLWQIFKDSIREGDGNRVFVCWKYLLLVFKNKNHTTMLRRQSYFLVSIIVFCQNVKLLN